MKSFSQELEIICAKLSEISERGGSEYLIKLEVKSLRDTKQLIEKVGLKEAEAFIQDNPHPKLWFVLFYFIIIKIVDLIKINI